MEFRLAQKQDLTPQMCQAILSDALDFCNIVELITTPGEILNIFVNYCEGRAKEPQFWIGLKDGKLVGYMITESMVKYRKPCLNISQGYIRQEFRGNGVADYCLEVIEKQGKNAGYKYVSCETSLDPNIYNRWITRYGYKRSATEFRKEI